MRLLSLRLRHFRRFGEAVFTFDPRLNVLVGPNEAGRGLSVKLIGCPTTSIVPSFG